MSSFLLPSGLICDQNDFSNGDVATLDHKYITTSWRPIVCFTFTLITTCLPSSFDSLNIYKVSTDLKGFHTMFGKLSVI